MIKTNMKIKDVITDNDIANIIETMCPYIIGKDKDGEVYYMPYAKELAFKIAVVSNIFEGIQFSEDDSLYDIVTTDADVNALIHDLPRLCQSRMDLDYIDRSVDTIVDFKKQMLIHNNEDLQAKLSKLLDLQAKAEETKVKISENIDNFLSALTAEQEYQKKFLEHMTPEETAALGKKFLSGDFDMSSLTKGAEK